MLDQNVVESSCLLFIIVSISSAQQEKAQGQHYLTMLEEKAFKQFLRLMSNFGYLVQIKFLPLLAISIACQCSLTNKAIKPLGKNQAQGFQKRYVVLKSQRVRAINQKRYKNNIYNKIIQQFKVIKKVLQDPAILLENIYIFKVINF